MTGDSVETSTLGFVRANPSTSDMSLSRSSSPPPMIGPVPTSTPASRNTLHPLSPSSPAGRQALSVIDDPNAHDSSPNIGMGNLATLRVLLVAATLVSVLLAVGVGEASVGETRPMPAAATSGLRPPPCLRPHELYDDSSESLYQRERPPNQEVIVDNLIYDIVIVLPGDHEQTRCAMMLIDSGNPHANLISRKFVDDCGLPHSPSKPSSLKRACYRLIPFMKGAKAFKAQIRKLRGVDGTVIRGQDGTVTVFWYGKNKRWSRRFLPIVSFRPTRYETTHTIVDSDLGADMILSWHEVDRLGLRDHFINAIPKPPEPASDADGKKLEEYKKNRAKKKAVREDSRGNDEGEPSGTSSADQTSK